uniref:rRNA 2'-O-methyltransferase fibrillarin-like n=1 Tax=Jaculus jaculus TaxID=51337 RepID=UPI001E1B2A5E|nr:rRNA 2'-O-methyltransferase fibrillarin-like [Jaculus jaculus]
MARSVSGRVTGPGSRVRVRGGGSGGGVGGGIARSLAPAETGRGSGPGGQRSGRAGGAGDEEREGNQEERSLEIFDSKCSDADNVYVEKLPIPAEEQNTQTSFIGITGMPHWSLSLRHTTSSPRQIIWEQSGCEGKMSFKNRQPVLIYLLRINLH